MAAAHYHAVSSARRFGGAPGDYMEIHRWFDAAKEVVPDVRHRAMRHHETGVVEAERIFGDVITNSDGRSVPVRTIAEQHVREDLGFVPNAADWFRNIKLEPWMTRARPLSREL